ncbi:MAG: hypothetical protein WKF48_02540 [Solirubrobacteraceae bacterium]
MSAPQDPVALLRALSSAGVQHVVIGGFAVISHGVVRATKDLDICPDPDPSNIDGDHAYAQLVSDAVGAEVEGIAVRICSLRHLRAMKRAAGRPQDLRDLADLAIAHGDDGV